MGSYGVTGCVVHSFLCLFVNCGVMRRSAMRFAFFWAPLGELWGPRPFDFDIQVDNLYFTRRTEPTRRDGRKREEEEGKE